MPRDLSQLAGTMFVAAMDEEIMRTASRTVYENRWLLLREDEIERGDGSPGIYSVLEKPDFAIVIPLQDDTLHLVQQYRYPVRERLWEFPQGSWQDAPGVDPVRLAHAELEEETGLRAGSMRSLGRAWLAPGYSSQGMHVFVASDLSQGGQRLEVEEQGLRVRPFRVAEFAEMIRDGTMVDVPSLAAWSLFKAKVSAL